ncbi:MAG: hypothetical protein MMC33_009151 [Icmadophila ericetorum]|nr:hypothetical protein [Icmadophila ericetorum]
MARRKRGTVQNIPQQNVKAPTQKNAQRGPAIADGNYQHQYTLAEEARYTERRRGGNGDLKLRNTHITFVSASDNTVVQDVVGEEDPLPLPKAQPSLESTVAEPRSHLSIEPTSSINHGVSDDAVQRNVVIGEAEDNLCVTDTVGFPEVIQTGLQPPRISDPTSILSDTSDSSEDVVLFSGRERSVRRKKHVKDALGSSKPNTIANLAYVQDQETTASRTPISSTELPPSNATAYEDRREEIVPTPFKNSRRGRRPAGRLLSTSDKPSSMRRQNEEEILADYIINARENSMFNDSLNTKLVNQLDIGSSGEDSWQDEEEDEEELESAPAKPRLGWTPEDLLDFEALSTSSELVDNLACIISKRSGSSGTQYLVVGEGCSVDDARWIPLSSLEMPGAAEQIQAFEATRKSVIQDFLKADDSDNTPNASELAALNLEDDLGMVQEEEEFLKQCRADTTDEQIARLLSKQEELGLGSEELMLFNGFDVPEGRRRPRASRPHAMANHRSMDPYDGFDVVDFERPSIGHKMKGRNRLASSSESSDSDAEKVLHMAWERDRSKKKKAKQERESLRAQGLLGKTNKIDMKAKYASGITFEQAKDEIKLFLLSTLESLPLPPLDKRDRKMIHEMASVFALKSKSIGSGKSRFPVLIKTSRTVDVDGDDILNLLAQRRFFPRRDKQTGRGPARARGANARGGAGGGGSGAAVSYRDGEVVGAAAPELGSDNRGRAMLEKMGWSTGTALGASNNPGIMQPVLHVIKTTKAGLG